MAKEALVTGPYPDPERSRRPLYTDMENADAVVVVAEDKVSASALAGGKG